jgi:hypothetical protein
MEPRKNVSPLLVFKFFEVNFVPFMDHLLDTDYVPRPLSTKDMVVGEA